MFLIVVCFLFVQQTNLQHDFDFFSFATMVLELELLESNIPVEEDVGEMQEAAKGELGGWRSAMEETDDRYDDYLDEDPRPPDQRDTTINQQGRENERSVLFFCSLFKFFFSPSSDILPFLLLI